MRLLSIEQKTKLGYLSKLSILDEKYQTVFRSRSENSKKQNQKFEY